MAPKTTRQDNEIEGLDAVSEFFEAQHVTLGKDPDHGKSKSTRAPGEFDRHLAPDQQLRHIVCVPGLAEDLREFAQSVLEKHPDLPIVSRAHKFPTAIKREIDIKGTRAHSIGRESDLQDVYRDTVARFCTVVAGELGAEAVQVAGQGDWEPDLLTWTKTSGSPRHANISHPPGLRTPPIYTLAPTPPSSDSESDGEETGSDSPDSSVEADNPDLREASVETELLGPDAPAGPDQPRRPPRPFADGYLWLNSRSKLTEQHQLNCLAIWEFKSMEAADMAKMAQIAYGYHGGEEFEGVCCTKRNSCLFHHHDLGVQRCKMGFDAPKCVLPSVQAAVKAQTSGQTPAKLTSKSYKDFMAQAGSKTSRLSKLVSEGTKHMLLQIWGEATYKDVTFVVFNAGNIELIGIRHRGSQTLFLSEIIRTPESSYYKLHTGLYLAAIYDLARRCKRFRKGGCRTWCDTDVLLDWNQISPEHFPNLLREQLRERPWLSMEMKMAKNKQTRVPFHDHEGYFVEALGPLESDPDSMTKFRKPSVKKPTEESYFWISFTSSFQCKAWKKGYVHLPKLLLPQATVLPGLLVRLADGDEVDVLRAEWDLVTSESSSIRYNAYGFYHHHPFSSKSGSLSTNTPAAVFLMDDPRRSVEYWSIKLKCHPAQFVTEAQRQVAGLTRQGFQRELERLLQKGFCIPALEICHLAINGDYNSSDVSIFNFARVARPCNRDRQAFAHWQSEYESGFGALLNPPNGTSRNALADEATDPAASALPSVGKKRAFEQVTPPKGGSRARRMRRGLGSDEDTEGSE